MGPNITWRISPLSSSLHAAEAIGRQEPLADARLAAALDAPARLLADEIRAVNLPWERFWSHLLGPSGEAGGRRLLVETALKKIAGRAARIEQVTTRLSALIAGVETAFQEAVPGFNEELPLRIGPLREQWEARGPGLLLAIGRHTEEALMVQECSVVALYPALGGAGRAHLSYNSARIEAVLANPHEKLPEVVRLAWLIAQLNIDLPTYSEAIHRDRLHHIAAYAMLPAALAAAEEVELVRNTPELISQAIAAWRLPAPPGVEPATFLGDWWQTYHETRPPWSVALVALDRLFG
jgi:hypothetical protein